MDSIGSVLLSSGKLQIFKNLSDILICTQKVKEGWSYVFGALAKDLSFHYIKNKVLYIKTKNYLWVNEIDYYKSNLLNKLTRLVGDEIIDLRITYDSTSSLSYKKNKKASVFNQSQCKEKNRGADSFKESLLKNIESRRLAGEKLCEICGDVWTKDGSCSFCRCTKSFH